MHERTTHSAEGTIALDPELSQAVTNGISVPLSALRASMESLAHGLETNDPRASVLRSALDEVVRMGRNVQALLDYTLPPPLRPLDCTRDEIAQAALHALGAERSARVMLAVENGAQRFFVDGPALAAALSHLIEAGLLETAHPVLASARPGSDAFLFSVVYVAPVHTPDEPSPITAEERGTANLGIALARQQIARMGGELAFHRTSGNQTVWLVRIPCTSKPAKQGLAA